MWRVPRCWLALWIGGALTSGVWTARADGVADEADLLFTSAAEHYRRGEYTEALKDFLASNRLAPNLNVVYNIARTYERTGHYPEAFRYYGQALEGELDPAARQRILAAIEQIRPRVAVLEIRSNPPGARVYVDRKDLGARGNAPLTLGLSGGRYSVIAELPGYHPVRADTGPIGAGESRAVELVLEPVLGSVRAESEPAGAKVRRDRGDGPVLCHTPCAFQAPPGRTIVHFERAGHRQAEVVANVEADRTTTVRTRLEVLTGTLVVSTDEPGALVEVDGRSIGFTPLITTLPAGEHGVRVSGRGYRAMERAVSVPAHREARVELTLVRNEEVTAASRVTESVSQAPASVTIIPRPELEALAYPTLAEALRGVRGVFLWDDRTYVTLGIRGPGFLGNYGNRLLVMSDGQPMNDNWLGSSYVGYDGRTDLADVERIEIVRGAGSVLYGTNAVSGVVNLVSRTRDARPGVELGVGAAGEGAGRARARVTIKKNDEAGAWLSVAGARGEGRDFYFPELVSGDSPVSDGVARGVDGFKAGTVQGRAWWRWLTLHYFAHSHEKHLPTAPFETLFGDTRTRQLDQRSALELKAEPHLARAVQLVSRVHLNDYRFRGYYPRAAGEGGLEVDTYQGTWLGLEERLVLTPSDRLRLTIGGEGQIHAVVEQRARDEEGYFLDSNEPYQVGAAYALVDASVSERVRVSAGARLDAYSTFGSSVSPRAALIVRPYDAGTTKLLLGKAFRAPSVYELYYNDDGYTQVSAQEMGELERPEISYSAEVEHTHELSSTVSMTGAVFGSYMRDLVITKGEGHALSPMYFANSEAPLVTGGAEASMRRDWRQGWMVAASYGFQRSKYLASDSLESLYKLEYSPEFKQVANQPEHVAAIKGAAPIIGRSLLLGSRLTIEGPRWDRYERVSEQEPELSSTLAPPGHVALFARQRRQRRTDPVAVWDIVLSGEQERFGLYWAVGVYNAFDWEYELPVGDEHTQRLVPQSGRTFLATLEVAL